MSRQRAAAIPDSPLEWRPQRPLATRRPVEVRDPIVEPLWSGTRVIAHLATTGPEAVSLQLLDAFGVDLSPEIGELADEIRASLLADDAIVDGVLTDQATRGGEGAAVVTEPRVSMMSLLVSQSATVDVSRKDVSTDPQEAFVALDLLRVDGQSLLDVPLLERKRLLESVLGQRERVRVSVHARPPIDGWVASWKGAGLKGAMLKAANSRYVPGGFSAEWRTVTQVAGRR